MCFSAFSVRRVQRCLAHSECSACFWHINIQLLKNKRLHRTSSFYGRGALTAQGQFYPGKPSPQLVPAHRKQPALVGWGTWEARDTGSP